MSQISSGVSGGAAVIGQTSGISLSAAGDYALLPISNATPPGGPDASALVTLSGTNSGASVSVQKQYTAGGPWTPLASVTVGGAPLGDPYSVPVADVDLVAGAITGLYAVRVLLNSITSGAVVVQGLSGPGSIGTAEAAILAELTAQNTLLKAQVLALSDLNSTDYLAAVGGSF